MCGFAAAWLYKHSRQALYKYFETGATTAFSANPTFVTSEMVCGREYVVIAMA